MFDNYESNFKTVIHLLLTIILIFHLLVDLLE